MDDLALSRADQFQLVPFQSVAVRENALLLFQRTRGVARHQWIASPEVSTELPVRFPPAFWRGHSGLDFRIAGTEDSDSIEIYLYAVDAVRAHIATLSGRVGAYPVPPGRYEVMVSRDSADGSRWQTRTVVLDVAAAARAIVAVDFSSED